MKKYLILITLLGSLISCNYNEPDQPVLKQQEMVTLSVITNQQNVFSFSEYVTKACIGSCPYSDYSCKARNGNVIITVNSPEEEIIEVKVILTL